MTRVVIAGGGIAALEALAGLHDLAEGRVEATLLAPEASFHYRPLSTAPPFTFRAERVRPLAELAERLGADHVSDGLAEVDGARRRVLTRKGDFLAYDVLVLAVGARTARSPQPGAVFKRDRQGIAAFAQLLRELEDGTVRRAAFVVPAGAAWPVDAYELALIAALAGRRAKAAPKLFLLTDEERPLAALGETAGAAVADELARARVELIADARLRHHQSRQESGLDAFSSVIARLTRSGPRRRGRRTVLHFGADAALAVERVVSLPAAHGPAIAGVPHDERGFIEVDGHGRVDGENEVYAAGDATHLLLKHSSLAAAQATAAAEAIAAAAGADVEPAPAPATLYGIVALPPHFAGPTGSPWLENGEPATHCLWWPPGHVSGRHLAPHLAASDHAVHTGLLWHPPGVPVAAPVDGGLHETRPQPAPPAKAVVDVDARARQLLAIQRAGREGERLGRELERKRFEFERHEHEVIARLEAAGYLRHAADPD